MTQAPERERAPRLSLPEVRRDDSVWLPAFLLALRTTVYGLIAVELVTLLLWIGSAHSGAGAAQTLRIGLAFWAAAHHATVHLGTGASTASIGVVPLGLTLLPAWLLHRGTRRLLLADDAVEGRAFVPALAAWYGVLVAVVALLARAPAVQPVPAEGFVGAALLAGVAAGTAVLRVRGRPARIQPEIAAAVGAACRAALALLGAGLLTTVVLVVAHHGAVGATQSALHPGASGVLGLTLIQLIALPVAAIWGSSVLAGPGFGLGAHTSLSITGAHLGRVPALPALAALPGHGAFSPALWLALAAPVGAGALVARHALPASGWRDQLRPAAVTAAASGVLWALLAVLADGSVGPGRLHVAGPSPWQLGLVLTGETGLGLLLVIAVRVLRRPR
jgi:hypothetical protein